MLPTGFPRTRAGVTPPEAAPTSSTKPVAAPAAPQAAAQGPRERRPASYDILWRSTAPLPPLDANGNPIEEPESDAAAPAAQQQSATPSPMDFSFFIDESPDNEIPSSSDPSVPPGAWVPATITGHTLVLHFTEVDTLIVGIPGVLIETILERGYALIVEMGSRLCPTRAFYASLQLGQMAAADASSVR